jgi:ParB family chromosome partitioning protein
MSIYDKLGQKTAGIKARTIEKGLDKTPKTAPGMFLNTAQRIDAAESKVEELEAKLREIESSGQGLEIPLNQLVEVEGRRRNLSASEFQELRENLRNNELVTPISVRKSENGKYEIVSGHNRVSAFRDLGRTTILAVLSTANILQADINAFYANLLQPNLPDYEKYLGFCMIKKRRPDMSHEQIADMAGISRPQVTKLMAFAALPKEVHRLLQVHVAAVGATAAQEFANLTKAGKGDQVIEAVAKIIDGELEQGQAVRLASIHDQSKTVNKSKSIKIRSGKSTFCELRRTEKVIRLAFKTVDEAEAIEASIHQLLETKAKLAK